MENTTTFSCVIDTTDASAELGLEIWLDDQQIFNQDSVTETMQFSHTLSDAPAQHELRFVMKNKQISHTVLDDQGNIVVDACLQLRDLAFDGINLGNIVTEKSQYQHDFNGTKPLTQDTFYGTMGCNGTVSLKFTAPLYIWLLENM
jgi:hypothetical protein